MNGSKVTAPNKTVMLFKGLYGDCFPGNQQTIALGKTLGGTVYEHTEGKEALAQLRQLPKGSKIILIGYSAGVATCVNIATATDVDAVIAIAGWYSVLERLPNISCPQYNFYQQQEIDDERATKDQKDAESAKKNKLQAPKKLGPYYARGTYTYSVAFDHRHIVAGVSDQVVQIVKSI